MLLRRVLTGFIGSFLAIVCGWLAGIVVSFCVIPANILIHGGLHGEHVPTAAFIELPWFVALFSPCFMLPVWLLVLVPLYVLIPHSSSLWRWPICTSLGIISGIGIVALFVSRPICTYPPPSVAGYYILAAIIAGTTCLVGSLTRTRFRDFHTRI